MIVTTYIDFGLYCVSILNNKISHLPVNFGKLVGPEAYNLLSISQVLVTVIDTILSSLNTFPHSASVNISTHLMESILETPYTLFLS